MEAQERPDNPNTGGRRWPGWAIPVAVLVLIAIGVGIWAYVATRPVPATVARRDIVQTVALKGDIIVPPSARADITTTYSAPVERVHATIGQRVSKGDVLVELSFPTVEAARAQAQQQVRSAETAYANAKKQADADVEAARKRLEQAQKAAPQGSGASDSSGGSGSAETQPQPSDQTPDHTGAAGEGTVQSPPSGPATSPEVEQARQALAQATADRDAALAPYSQQLEAARQALKEVQTGARVANITSPIAGTVLALNAQPGQTLKGDGKTVVATVVDLDALQVAAELDPDQLNTVKPGMRATLTVRDIPNRQFEGKVARIISRPTSSLGGLMQGQQYVALVSFTNDGGLVKPQMSADVRVQSDAVRDVAAVPNDAVDHDASGRPIVHVLRNGQWQTAVVQTGVRGDDYTEIKAGVEPGETIRVTPSVVHAGSR